MQYAVKAVCMASLHAPDLTSLSYSCFVLYWGACLLHHDKTPACTRLISNRLQSYISMLSLASYWSCSHKLGTALTGIASCINEALCWSAEWA